MFNLHIISNEKLSSNWETLLPVVQRTIIVKCMRSKIEKMRKKIKTHQSIRNQIQTIVIETTITSGWMTGIWNAIQILKHVINIFLRYSHEFKSEYFRKQIKCKNIQYIEYYKYYCIVLLPFKKINSIFSQISFYRFLFWFWFQ